MVRAVVKKSKIEGKGLFATHNIPVGDSIIEYTGERITKAEEARRERENQQREGGGATYILLFTKTHAIDGAVGGNESRFANHSCDPNCDIVIKDNAAFIAAARNIHKGEELTYDYAYDKNDPKEVCRCGSSLCRGFINEL